MPIEIHNSTAPSTSLPERRAQPQKRFHPRRTGSKNNNNSKPADAYSVSAGGIVFRRRGSVVEIFFIKDPYQRWTFPKGKQELGETFAQTAIREIQEETGLGKLRYVAPLGKTSFRFRREIGVIHKVVHYFLFEAPSDAKPTFKRREDVPEGREVVLEGAWVPLHRAFSVSSYKNSDHLLAQAFRLIASAS